MSCTCGALLPEDARFCHKCGKPQYEEDIARINAEESEAAAARASSLARSANAAAPASGSPAGRIVRITLAVALSAFIALMLVPQIAPLFIVIFLAAGFTAVRIYLSRAAEPLKLIAAAFVGALPWLWFSIPAAIGCVLVFSPQGRQAIEAMNKPETAQLLALLRSPADFASQVAQVFLVCTASGALGGILGVTWHTRNRPSH